MEWKLSRGLVSVHVHVHVSNDSAVDPDLLRFLSPLQREHISLTGEYTWPDTNHIRAGYQPLRRPTER